MKHKHLIKSVLPGSIAEELEIEAGDKLISINDSEIEDVFDYHFYVNDEYLTLLIEKANGEEWELEIEKGIIIRDDIRSRLTESVETALNHANNLVKIEILKQTGNEIEIKERTLYNIFEEIFASMGELATRQLPYVTTFLDKVIDYTAKNGSDIDGFLKWWDINSDKITLILAHAVPLNQLHATTFHAQHLRHTNAPALHPLAHLHAKSDNDDRMYLYPGPNHMYSLPTNLLHDVQMHFPAHVQSPSVATTNCVLRPLNHHHTPPQHS